MTERTLRPYEFPSADSQENFGDDQLVYVYWEGNTLFFAPGCFRVPRNMTWEAFRQSVVDPWAAADPDYNPKAAKSWRIGDRALKADPGRSLQDLGIGHKALIKFRT